MSKGVFESGAQKRKKQKEIDELKKKHPKLTNYFSVNANQSCSDKCESEFTEQEKVQENESNNISISSENKCNEVSEVSSCVGIKNLNSSDTFINVNDPRESLEIKTATECSDTVKSNETTAIEFVQKDPALWPLKINENEIDRNKYLNKGPLFFQNKNSSFEASKRTCAKQNRYFSSKYFQRVLSNNEKYDRNWIMYSESSGNVFCFACTLFSIDQENVFIKEGFSNWKKADETIKGHENSKEHNRCMLDWLQFMNKKSNIDKQLVNVTQREVQYWIEILKRIVAVIKFLAERGLPFRGTNEVIGSKNNGNYLGILELISEFDPVLKNHINDYANKGRGNVSYFSKTICEEFIELMAKQVMQQIITEIKTAKYWGLVVDSTPDISHADQLSVIFRYYLNGQVQERFLCFLAIKSHTGKSLEEEILNLLQLHSIDIADCRAQTYDNASNMSGKYSGLQARLKEKNKLAVYVPCVGHSLNLVGECSVGECTNSRNFFGLLQRLYAFFSASTHRWNVLIEHNAKLKSLSDTRWSARVNASKDLIENFDSIYESLSKIAADAEQKSDTRHEAACLQKNMTKLENVFMAILWYRILNRFNSVSVFLQKIEIDLSAAASMLLSLVEFVKQLREELLTIENEAKNLSSFVEQEYATVQKRKTKKKLSDGEIQDEVFNKSEKFRIETFYVIIDKITAELTKRSEAYKYITNLFGFLSKLLVLEIDEIRNCAKNLVEVYSQDLENTLFSELEQFICLLKLQPNGFFSNKKEDKTNNILNPLLALNWIIDFQLINVFPNVYVAYRLLLTIPIANCEAERSFSVLKRVKNMYRSTMLDKRLSSLARLVIENDLLRALDFSDLIKEFAESKSRKKFIL